MSLSIYNSFVNLDLSNNQVKIGGFENILDFSEIDVSVSYNVSGVISYTLYYQYSQDKINVDYESTQVVTNQTETKFFKIECKQRYFKLKIVANSDVNLNIQTVYKNTPTYSVISRGSLTIANNFAITSGTRTTGINLSNLCLNTLTIYGNSSATTTLTLCFSNDGVNWYDSQYTINITGSSNFGVGLNINPLYLSIKSSASVTLTAICDYC
jgi:hypothetical protein